MNSADRLDLTLNTWAKAWVRLTGMPAFVVTAKA